MQRNIDGRDRARRRQKVDGQGVYLMGPGMPSVFTFDAGSMSCSVSWGTMGAPGPLAQGDSRDDLWYNFPQYPSNPLSPTLRENTG